MEDYTRPDMDKEQLMAVLQGETKNEAKMSQVQSEIKKEEAEMQEAQQQDEVEALKQEDTEIDHVFYKKQNTEDGTVIAIEDISPEQTLRAQLESLQTEDSIQVTIFPVQEKSETPSIEESVTPTEPSIQETTSSVQEHIQIPKAEELVTEAETAAEVTECWDEYLVQNVDEMHSGESSELFASLFANTQNLTFSGQHDTQTGWHFPAGPGLADEVTCPLWQFPAVSYYPPAEPTVPFEGESPISHFCFSQL